MLPGLGVGPGGQEPGGWGCGVGWCVGAEVRSMVLRGGTRTRRARAASEELMLHSPGERGREQVAMSPDAGVC